MCTLLALVIGVVALWCALYVDIWIAIRLVGITAAVLALAYWVVSIAVTLGLAVIALCVWRLWQLVSGSAQ